MRSHYWIEDLSMGMTSKMKKSCGRNMLLCQVGRGDSDGQTLRHSVWPRLLSAKHDENYKQITASVHAWDNKNDTPPRKVLQSTSNMGRRLKFNMRV